MSVGALSIAAEGYACEIVPDHGGALLSLRDRQGEILRAGHLAETAADPRNAAAFPCVPWFARLYDGLVFGGIRHEIAPTLPDCAPDHPLHGEGWVGAWEVMTHTEDRVICRFASDGRAPGGFPFAYAATQDFRLTRDGLTVRLALTNAADTMMPAGLGLHPYFVRAADTRIAFHASKRWTPPAAGQGRLSPIAGRLGAGAPAALPDETLDHTFAGFGGEAIISGAGGAVLRLKSDAPALHVFAPAGEAYFCLEPVTHLPGELTRGASGFGGRVLNPLEIMSVTMVIGR